MRRRRKRSKIWLRHTLTEHQILAWAYAFHQLKGGSWVQRWSAIDTALKKGLHGLPGGSSLARLLAARRGVRNRKGLPPFTVPQIVRWADAYHATHGEWL